MTLLFNHRYNLQVRTALHVVTRRYTSLHVVTRRYTALHGVTRRYTALHGVTRRYTTFTWRYRDVTVTLPWRYKFDRGSKKKTTYIHTVRYVSIQDLADIVDFWLRTDSPTKFGCNLNLLQSHTIVLIQTEFKYISSAVDLAELLGVRTSSFTFLRACFLRC